MTTTTTTKIGKIVPTQTALEIIKDAQAPKVILAELISSHPDPLKRSFLSSLSRELFDLSKKHDLVIVIAPKPEPKK